MYIGETTKSMVTRLKGHYSDACSHIRYDYNMALKGNWLTWLYLNCKIPKVKILQHVKEGIKESDEKHLIIKYSDKGTLVNLKHNINVNQSWEFSLIEPKIRKILQEKSYDEIIGKMYEYRDFVPTDKRVAEFLLKFMGLKHHSSRAINNQKIASNYITPENINNGYIDSLVKKELKEEAEIKATKEEIRALEMAKLNNPKPKTYLKKVKNIKDLWDLMKRYDNEKNDNEKYLIRLVIDDTFKNNKFIR